MIGHCLSMRLLEVQEAAGQGEGVEAAPLNAPVALLGAPRRDGASRARSYALRGDASEVSGQLRLTVAATLHATVR